MGAMRPGRTVKRGGEARPASARRPFAALLVVAVALLFAHVARLGHLVFVPHVRCAHGALVHAHAEPAAGDAAARPGDAPTRAPVVQASPTADGDHDHCDGLAVAPARIDPPASIAPSAVIAWCAAPDTARPRPAATVVALLSLAPKGSPPA